MGKFLSTQMLRLGSAFCFLFWVWGSGFAGKGSSVRRPLRNSQDLFFNAKSLQAEPRVSAGLHAGCDFCVGGSFGCDSVEFLPHLKP